MLALDLHIYPALETKPHLQQHADVDSLLAWNAEGVAAAITETVSLLLLLLLLLLLATVGRLLSACVSRYLHNSVGQ